MLILITHLTSAKIDHPLLYSINFTKMYFLVCNIYKWWLSCRAICGRVGYFWLPFFSLTRTYSLPKKNKKWKNKTWTLFTQLLIFSSFLVIFSVVWDTILKKSFLGLSLSSYHVTHYFTICTSVSLSVSFIEFYAVSWVQDLPFLKFIYLIWVIH